MIESIASFSLWDWLDVVGLSLVFAGVVGEIWSDKKHNKTWESFWGYVLIAGLGLELIAMPFHLLEAARLNKEGSEARRLAGVAYERAERETTKRIELEKQLWETKLAVTNLNPLKQPIGSVVAFVQFRTPQVKTIDRGRDYADSLGIASLSLGRSASVTSNRFAIRLVANKFIEWSGEDFSLQFVMDPHNPRHNLGNEIAEAVFEWDTFWFTHVFLPIDTEILEGRGTVIINGLVSREFSIPAGKLRGASLMWTVTKASK